MLRRVVNLALGVGLVALFLGAQLGHQHTDELASDVHACRICKIHQSLTVELPHLSVLPTSAVFVGGSLLRAVRAPQLAWLPNSTDSRAPPVASKPCRFVD